MRVGAEQSQGRRDLRKTCLLVITYSLLTVPGVGTVPWMHGDMVAQGTRLGGDMVPRSGC